MPRQTKQPGAPPRATTDRPVRSETATTIGGMPAWRDLPEETRGTLTDLMARLILEHAQISSPAVTDGGRS